MSERERVAGEQPYLDDAGAVLEVGEGPHDLLAQSLHRLLPRAGETPDELGDTSWRERGRETGRETSRESGLRLSYSPTHKTRLNPTNNTGT